MVGERPVVLVKLRPRYLLYVRGTSPEATGHDKDSSSCIVRGRGRARLDGPRKLHRFGEIPGLNDERDVNIPVDQGEL